ncbi:hypothetical protein A3860_00280 [Niastella vici]|uniref:Uncharacterized protein n=1 Tax=Niastella vici TaxID=1703345 RepID=A0A1V9G8D5_9BACT|nr:hypothetical protein [Niastella vici]OQP66842.1 hypothetical protein A3860_00280 [Niastella vici]
MTFDFYQQYKDYSTTDLLKIVKRPAEYQPAAVEAATQLLSERPVTSEEMQFVDQYFQDLEDSAKAKKEKIDALKNEATDLLEPILQPGENVEPPPAHKQQFHFLIFGSGIYCHATLFSLFIVRQVVKVSVP